MKKQWQLEKSEEKQIRAAVVSRLLRKLYPSDQVELHHHNAFQLLVAVILSAQCTDVRVNLVTPGLFARFSSPKDFAGADKKELELLIHSTGFYHNKAKNIIGCAKVLLEHHAGVVPDTLEELITLPGVGRKTANVVLGAAFGKTEGVVVDTHVARLSHRLGFTIEKDAVKIEYDLMPLISKKHWFHFSHSLILHGRRICAARKPLCRDCSIQQYCPSSFF